jgi:class 3 adenylate cyclase
MSIIKFLSEGAKTQHALAASFDLSGFSPFCLHPNAHAYLACYIANLFDLLESSFAEIPALQTTPSKPAQAPLPTLSKYTGDGALLLWVADTAAEFTSAYSTSIVLALRRFQQCLPARVATWEKEWHTNSLPCRARVGIAAGPVQRLKRQVDTLIPETMDYAGYPINLAVRLQDHCPEVGFMIHQPVQPQLDGLLAMRAVKPKGALDEPVYVFAEDYQHLSQKDELLASCKLKPIR